MADPFGLHQNIFFQEFSVSEAAWRNWSMFRSDESCWIVVASTTWEVRLFSGDFLSESLVLCFFFLKAILTSLQWREERTLNTHEA